MCRGGNISANKVGGSVVQNTEAALRVFLLVCNILDNLSSRRPPIARGPCLHFCVYAYPYLKTLIYSLGTTFRNK